jgi:hypothetical protein
VIALMCIVEVAFPQAYGKLAPESADGLTVPAHIGWWLMELPVTLVFVSLFWVLTPNKQPVQIVLACVLSGHYLYRGWFYPLTIKVHPESKSGFSLVTALGGWIVTLMHGYLNAKWIGKHNPRFKRGYDYFKTPNFWIGLAVYYVGFFLIFQQDQIMRDIRNDPNAKRYEIPRGGLWDYSASGNYLAELVCWFGFWILMDFGPNGGFIFFVSLFNLVPRAASNYGWYENKFGEEFTSLHRAKLVPGVW